MRNGSPPEYIAELFHRPDTYSNLRNCNFMMPRYDTITYDKHSIKLKGPYFLRRLPTRIRSLCETGGEGGGERNSLCYTNEKKGRSGAGQPNVRSSYRMVAKGTVNSLTKSLSSSNVLVLTVHKTQ